MKSTTYTLPTTDRSGLAALVQQLRRPAPDTPESQLAALKFQLHQLRHQLTQARQQAAQLHADAMARAHREDRLQRHLIGDVDNRRQWRAKMGLHGSHQVRITVTARTIDIKDV